MDVVSHMACLANQSALFQHSVVMPWRNLLITSADLTHHELHLIQLNSNVHLTFFQDCLPSYEKKCSTVNERQCRSVPDQECTTVNEQQCSEVVEQQCNTVEEEECTTVEEEVSCIAHLAFVDTFYKEGY